MCSPEEASRGAVPVQDADRLRSVNRATSPTSARILAATTGPTPVRSIRVELRARTRVFSSLVEALIFGLDGDHLGELLQGEPLAGFRPGPGVAHR